MINVFLKLILFCWITIPYLDYGQTEQEQVSTKTLYRKIILPEEINSVIDTTQRTIILTNFEFNIHAYTFSLLKYGDVIRTKVSYSSDTLIYRLLSRKELCYSVTIKDSLGRITSSGKVKGVGPFQFTINTTLENNTAYFEYFYSYYLIRIGEWKILNKDGKHKIVNYVYDKLIDIYKTMNKDRDISAKRRKAYIRKKHLKKDFIEE